MLVPAAASASEVTWALLPVRAESPPPRDPTLLRLTRSVAEALRSTVEGKIRVVPRDLRDDACPSPDGLCPRDVASLVGADRVVSMLLTPGFKTLKLRIYSKEVGLQDSGVLECRWAMGLAVCATEPLSGIVREQRNEGGAEAVKRRFARLGKKLKGCEKKGFAHLTAPELPDALDVTFRLSAKGRAIDVRLDPAGYDEVPAYACMARVVETLEIPKDVEPPKQAQRFRLPH